MKKSIFITIFQ